MNAAFDSIDELRGIYQDKIETGDSADCLAAVSNRPHPRAPDVPYLAALAKSDADRGAASPGRHPPAAFRLPLLLAPEVPQDRAQALEAALDKTLTRILIFELKWKRCAWWSIPFPRLKCAN